MNIRTPPLLFWNCSFYFAFIDYTIPDVSTYDKTRSQRSTTTKSRKSTNDQNGPKRKSKNKRRTQATQDEEVSDTDTEQQTSEQKTFFSMSIQGGLPFVVNFLLLHKFFEI